MTTVTDTARRLPRWSSPLNNRAARQTRGVRYRPAPGGWLRWRESVRAVSGWLGRHRWRLDALPRRGQRHRAGTGRCADLPDPPLRFWLPAGRWVRSGPGPPEFSRAVIDGVVGIVMTRSTANAGAAVDLLRRASQNRNVELREGD